jgi:hypothetical protein
MTQEAANSRSLFSRDVNYLRDMALFWPFVLYSIFGVASAFSPANRSLAVRCAVVAAIAILLAKEKLLLFFVTLGFIAIQCAIYLALHRWNWGVFAAGLLTSTTFLVANRYWRKPKLSYGLPRQFRLVDALWSVGSLIISLMLGYVVSPYN